MHDAPNATRPFECWTFGSECDGGFAQFTVASSKETYAIASDWTDVELASIPCAYSTAEGMLARASVGAETVFITGASGGVGSAAIQLAKRRGAKVIAVSSKAKADDVKAVGADQVIDRDADPVEALGTDSVDVVLDLVAGPSWPKLLEILKRGGRYATSGAIAGPIVELDVRTLYLKDLSFFGSTYQDRSVFENLVGYIERNEIRPLVAKNLSTLPILSPHNRTFCPRRIQASWSWCQRLPDLSATANDRGRRAGLCGFRLLTSSATALCDDRLHRDCRLRQPG